MKGNSKQGTPDPGTPKMGFQIGVNQDGTIRVTFAKPLTQMTLSIDEALNFAHSLGAAMAAAAYQKGRTDQESDSEKRIVIAGTDDVRQIGNQKRPDRN